MVSTIHLSATWSIRLSLQATTLATASATSIPTSSSPTAVRTVTAPPNPAATTTSSLSSTQGQDDQGTGVSAGTIAGIAVGVTLATIMVVGLLGWSVWRHKGRSRATRNEKQSLKERSDTTINNKGRSGDGGSSGRWKWGQELPGEVYQRPELEDAQRGSQRYEISGQSRQRTELEDSYQPHRAYELSVESYR